LLLTIQAKKLTFQASQAGFFLYQPGKDKADFSGRLKA